ncbi:alcohol acetyltransferase [Leucobacter sp. L43]|uniref:alcohol acetyltransferase n=1 Tax=Leucobacter sp. L43 TaxID=2798040 RepID=UPI0019057963|nr:alcohol acetyltransferase [Leucobacter sp. L43]
MPASWVRLDNASNIFLAARSDADPKVFRISAEVDHAVEPRLLQQALEATYERYRLYHAVLRGGMFWYYLQTSDLRPTVSPEHLPTCAPIYREDRRNLLFRVAYRRQRIILEIFHALSDGTGALWFLTDLVTAYLRAQGAGAAGADGGDTALPADPASQPVEDEPHPAHELIADSFSHYFHRTREPFAPADAESEAPRTAPLRTAATAALRIPRWLRAPRTRVHRIRGTRTPDNRTRVVELTMPAPAVLALARAQQTSLTIYLTALFFRALRESIGPLGHANTLAASIPINLRQFFPSTSARNFFATVRVEHAFDADGAGDDLGSICRELEAQFKPKATPQALERKLRRLIRFERTPLLRILPRVLKDAILRLINWGNNRGLSVAVSNLGRVVLPEPAGSRVGRMLFHVSAVRPQFCAMSHAGLLTISFTSPFVETNHVRAFVRMLTDSGVDVSVAAARVTEDELAPQEPGA